MLESRADALAGRTLRGLADRAGDRDAVEHLLLGADRTIGEIGFCLLSSVAAPLRWSFSTGRVVSRLVCWVLLVLLFGAFGAGVWFVLQTRIDVGQGMPP